MSSTTEHDKPTAAESTTDTVPTDTEILPPPPSTVQEEAVAAEPEPVVEERKTASSWLNNLGFSPQLTSQLTNLSSSIIQVTSKVSAAANNLVQKSLPQRPSSPDDNAEQTPVPTKAEDGQQTGEETNEANKDLTSRRCSMHANRWSPTLSIVLGILTDLSSTVMKSAQQLKHAVEEKSLLGNFTKEHEKFLVEKRTQQRREEAAVPPWIGYVEEEEMKNQILALSKVGPVRHSPPKSKNSSVALLRKSAISFAIHRQVLTITSTWLLSIQLHWPLSTSTRT